MTKRLTQEQTAVEQFDGKHAIVSAVAGSGKSHTLVYRVAREIEKGIDPRRILVLMFNANAQEEFAARMRALCAEKGVTAPDVQTFHAFGGRVCSWLEAQGLLPRAELMTEDWKVLNLAKEALVAANLEQDDEERIEIDVTVVTEFQSLVDFAKNTLSITGEGVHQSSVAPVYMRAMQLMETLRKQRGLRTFTDLLFDPVCALRRDPRCSLALEGRFDAIIVDEYQDTNACQQLFLRHLAGEHASVVVCGDEDQAIYSFRGSSPDFMLNVFQADYPDAARFNLSQTFRFGHAVSLVANHVISQNTSRHPKICISGGGRSTSIDFRMYQEDGPGPVALDACDRWVQSGRSLGEIAILVRAYAHTMPVEVSLLTNDIPYRIEGASPFFDRREVLALRGIMLLACDRLHTLASREQIAAIVAAMLSVPTLYLRRDVIDELAHSISLSPRSFIPIMKEFAATYQAPRRHFVDKIWTAIKHWQYFARFAATSAASGALNEIINRLDLLTFFKRNNPRPDIAAEKQRMCQEMIRFAQSGRYTLLEFALLLEDLSVTFEEGKDRDDAVVITSAHKSKGLEYPLVILPDLVDGLFPSFLCPPHEVTPAMLEDERRLFYVALTRAVDRLVLIAPHDPRLLEWMGQSRSRYPVGVKLRASRFLYEGNVMLSTFLARQIEEGAPLPQALIERARSPDDLAIAQAYLDAVDHMSNDLQQAVEAAVRNAVVPDEPPSILDELLAA